MDKSRSEWADYKKQESVEEELDAHKKDKYVPLFPYQHLAVITA